MKTGVERNVNYQMAGIQEPIPIENTASPIETEVKITNDVKLENIPIENINYGSNVREKYSDDDFAYLKDSISKYGILQPITVYKEDDNYIVKLGNARLQACKELYEDGDSRFKYINCIVIGVVEKSDVIVDQIIENLRRKDLTDADLLYILPTLKKQGFSDEKISELYKGRSKKTIQNLFSIINDINEDEELTQMLKDGDTTFAKISETKKIDDRITRVSLLRENKDTSTPDFRKKINEVKSKGKKITSIPVDGNVNNSEGNIFNIKCRENQIVITVVNGSVDKIYEVVVKFLNKKYCKKLNILAKINKKASN